jgi:hypothetical protein
VREKQTLSGAAQIYDGEVLQTLVEIMRDKDVIATARINTSQ